MKIAVIGSRRLYPDEALLEAHLSEATEIVSGGAKGVDMCVAAYAKKQGISLTEILPEYTRYGRAAPVLRNKIIVDMAEKVVAFWDGKSSGTQGVIRYAERIGKPCKVVLVGEDIRKR